MNSIKYTSISLVLLCSFFCSFVKIHPTSAEEAKKNEFFHAFITNKADSLPQKISNMFNKNKTSILISGVLSLLSIDPFFSKIKNIFSPRKKALRCVVNQGCLNLLDNLTMLPCGHALCSNHWNTSLMMDNGREEKVWCPECNTVHNHNDYKNYRVVLDSSEHPATYISFYPATNPSLLNEQLQNHSYLKKHILTQLKNPDNHECSICFNSYKIPLAITACGHIFCSECLLKWFTSANTCPLCRTTLNKNSVSFACEGKKDILDALPQREAQSLAHSFTPLSLQNKAVFPFYRVIKEKITTNTALLPPSSRTIHSLSSQPYTVINTLPVKAQYLFYTLIALYATSLFYKADNLSPQDVEKKLHLLYEQWDKNEPSLPLLWKPLLKKIKERWQYLEEKEKLLPCERKDLKNLIYKAKKADIALFIRLYKKEVLRKKIEKKGAIWDFFKKKKCDLETVWFGCKQLIPLAFIDAYLIYSLITKEYLKIFLTLPLMMLTSALSLKELSKLFLLKTIKSKDTSFFAIPELSTTLLKQELEKEIQTCLQEEKKYFYDLSPLEENLFFSHLF